MLVAFFWASVLWAQTLATSTQQIRWKQRNVVAEHCPQRSVLWRLPTKTTNMDWPTKTISNMNHGILALKKSWFITWSLAKLKHLRPFFWVASHAQRKPCRVPCPHGELWPAPKKKSVGAMPKERWKPCHLARTMGQGVVEGQILFSFWPLEM